MSKNVVFIVFCGLLTIVSATWADDAPPRPSSFYGTVTVEGKPVSTAADVSVTAAVGELAATPIFTTLDGSGPETVFRIDVPADFPETPEVEGGREGESLVFRINGTVVPEVAAWHDGTYVRLDLTAPSGSDLSFDGPGGITVVPGETLTLSFTVTNPGPEDATGVAVDATLPALTTFIAAGDGGSESAGLVTWPSFDLAAGASATRALTLEVAPSVPAGVEQISSAGTVADDGTHGFDPDASNNTATIALVVDAAPDLAVTKTDGLDEVAAGDFVTYTLTVSNDGTQDAVGVQLIDHLPPAMTFFTATDDGGETTPGIVTWPAFGLAVGETVTRQVHLRYDGAVGQLEITNEATAYPGNGPDVDASDNTAAETTPVRQDIDLDVVTVDPSPAVVDPQTLDLAGEVVVELGNPGNADSGGAFDVCVFEDLDGDALFDVAIDNLLGQVRSAEAVPAGGATISVPVAGKVLFRDNWIYAFVDCTDAVAEPDETNNVDRSGDCVAVPTPEDFQPVVELSWPADDTRLEEPFAQETMSTPIVVQLTDDNGDGRIDELDGPDIVFVAADLIDVLNPRLRLRAIHGDTGDSIFAVTPPASESLTFSLSGLAAGDIDGDGKVEIVVSTPSPPLPGLSGFSNHLTAYEHTGQVKWTQSHPYSTHPTGATFTNRDNPTIANLDGVGPPEIIVGANVFDNDGALLWTGAGGQAYQSARNDDDVDSGAISVVADLDLDGDLELVTGNTTYHHDGSIYWQIPMDDGYPAIGNFDADDHPEIVVVARGFVRLHEHDGTLIWGPVSLPGVDPEAGGAPTVADFDGDGEAEIGAAGSDFFAVFETDGTVRWQSSTQDDSSNQTGSTVFDLDGDGRYEVIYRDETHLRIYRGEDGTVLFEDPFSSFTANEEPVVADVDNDGRAEIVVTSDFAMAVSAPERTAGLRVYGDANDNWVGTRPIWNQHAYHVGNVNDDGTIPAQPARGWLTHNTFRANAQPAEGAFATADLTASRLVVDVTAYPTLVFTARIGNSGEVVAPAQTPVAFYDGDPGAGGRLIAVTALGQALEPGAFLDLGVTGTSSGFGVAEVFVVANEDGFRRECDLTNNRHGMTYDTDDVGLLLTKDNGENNVQPGVATTYTLTVTNANLAARSGVVLSDTLPPGTSFVSAGGGGTESAGVVTWPAFDLPGGASAVRTLSLLVDEAISVSSITNTATVTDDGSLGPDPTPANNTAADTDAVSTVRADAGGPYSGDEGTPILLDASGSSDRDGTVALFEWDLDGDGLFDDASGSTVSHAFDDDGTFLVTVRVTGDSGETDTDSAEVSVANLPPAFGVVADPAAADEGDVVLLEVPFTDPGAGDTHTATIDWGDGTTTAGTVTAGTVTAGMITAGHGYPDEGDYPVRACVLDDDGGGACVDLIAAVANVAPVVLAEDDPALSDWQVEDVDPTQPGQWTVAEDGLSVLQEINGNPTAFYSPFLSTGVTVQASLRIEGSGDDDHVGFLLGFQPGDLSNPDADFLVVDWRRIDQTAETPCGPAPGFRGLAVSRVRGLPDAAELWARADLEPCGGGTIEVLAHGATLGNVGWERQLDYVFRFETSPTHLRIWVDDVLEFDLEGDFNFGPGRFAFYNYSQAGVRYGALSASGQSLLEGEEATIRVPFSDAGIQDLHTAAIDWGDGTVEPAQVVEETGFGTVTASRLFPDDGPFDTRICVDDGDGGEGCGTRSLTVLNALPEVDLAPLFDGYTDRGVDIAGSYADAGILDTHTATIDWGDGTVEPLVLTETGGGSGTFAASRFYAAVGDYDIEVCVTDDDGGTACRPSLVRWREPIPDLAVDLQASRTAVRPGQLLGYTLRLENRGTLPATGVDAILDLPPELTVTVGSGPGFSVTDTGSGQRVRWALDGLSSGARQYLGVETLAAAVLPFGQEALAVATVSDDGAEGPDAQPADNTAEIRVLLWDENTPIVEAGFNLGRGDRAGIVPSSESSFHPASQAFDGSLDSSWRVACGDAVNQGGSPYLEVQLPADALIRGVGYFADRAFSGQDFLAGHLELADAAEALYDSGLVKLVPPRDLLLDLPDTQNVSRFRFTPTADTSCEPALGELKILGVYGDGRSTRVAEGEPVYAAALVLAADAVATGEIAWGDGATDPGSLFVRDERALLEGQHVYPDDGVFPADFCVTDDGGFTGCGALEVQVDNVAPDVNDDPEVDLRLWQVEEYEAPGQPAADWVVAEDGRSVVQRNNPVASILYGDFQALGRRIEGTVRVDDTSDNDQIGFVLGFEPGDTDNPDAEYILINWRKESQNAGEDSCVGRITALAGLSVSRVFGLPDGHELWGQQDLECNGFDNGVEELARGLTLGSTGWQPFVDYRFTIEYTLERLRVSVNGQLEIDIDGRFPAGLMGFFDLSQREVVFKAFQHPFWIADEGSALRLEVSFTDPGADTHTADVDWDDGAITAAAVEPGTASSRVVGEHTYLDDRTYGAEVCVTDDDGGTGCGTFPIVVRNVPPTVDAGGDLITPFGTATELTATFGDVGLEDTHTATVDWGDGNVETVEATSTGPGAGTVYAAHLYATNETFTVELCVTDDDGGAGCDNLLVEITNSHAPEVGIIAVPSYEGETVSLDASFTDADPVDQHTATVTWGDGSLPEQVPVVPNGLGGSLLALHRYLDEGTFPVEVCVTDSVGLGDCATAEQQVVNLPPEPGYVDLTRFVVEDGPTTAGSSDWTVSDGGRRAVQSANSPASFFYSGFSALNARVSGFFRLEQNDNDYVGLALGFEPGDTRNPDADHLLVSWKRVTEGSAVQGLRVYRVRGAPADHFRIDTQPEAELLATGATLGSAGWIGDRAYPFTVELTAERFRLWIDGGLEVDVTAPADDPFSDGRFALYTVANPIVIFYDVIAGAIDSVDEVHEPLTPQLADLRSWTQEDWDLNPPEPAGVWVLTADGRGVTETANSRATFLYSDFAVSWSPVGAMVRPLQDNDYFGFALGFDPGDATAPDSDLLVVVWKQTTEGDAVRGLRVYRVQGTPPSFFLINQVPQATLLAAATTLGNVGYVNHTNYDFRLHLQPDRFRLWVNDRLEVDVAGDFADTDLGDGRFALYAAGMQGVGFRDVFHEAVTVLNEGETTPDLAAVFSDEGILDVHSASVDWGDGTPAEPASIIRGAGVGTVAVAAGHLLADDVVTEARTCVDDGDGGTACGDLPVRARNLPPVVEAGPDTVAAAFVPLPLAVPFIDPGTGDTHTATVDWGDGSVESASVDQGAGSGTVVADHVYGAAGLYTVEVCVTDDDGGVGCDSAAITVSAAPPVIEVVKADTLLTDGNGDGVLNPGEVLGYEVTVTNSGGSPATSVVLSDILPEHTAIVAGSVSSATGTVLSEDPLGVDLASVAVGEAVTVSFQVTLAAALPAGLAEISNQGVVTSAGLDPVASDDPDTAAPGDPTRTPVAGDPELTATKSDELTVDADLDGVPSPGDKLRYILTVSNIGTGAASGALVRDLIPENASVVPGSVTTDTGTVLTEDPVEIEIGTLAAGAAVTATFRVTIDDPFPADLLSVENQARVTSGELPAVLTDDPSTAEVVDPTVTEVFIPVALSVDDVSVTEGDPGDTKAAVFDLVLDRPSNRPVTVDYATVTGDSAVEGVDYEAVSGSLTLPAAETSAPVSVPVLGDLLDEADETFGLILSLPEGQTVPVSLARGEATATLLDDDEALVSIGNVVVVEGDAGTTTDAVFTVDLSNPSDRTIEVSYTTVDETAAAGTDYDATSGSLAIVPGEQEATVSVTVRGDDFLEDDETFRVDLFDPVNVTFSDSSGLCSILDDDHCIGPNLLINGSAESTPVDGELTGWTEVLGDDWTYGLFGPGAADGDAYFVSSTADVAELAQDVDATAYAARIDAGIQEFDVSARLSQGDGVLPPATRLIVELRDASNTVALSVWDSGAPVVIGGWIEVSTTLVAQIGTRGIRVRLVTEASEPGGNLGYFDNVVVRSLGAPAVWIDDVTVYEEDGIAADFPVHLACVTGNEVTVQAQTADGTALADQDYLATAADLVFAVGQTETSAAVPIVSDDVDEPVESFFVDLSDLTGLSAAILLDPQAIGTIHDGRWCPRTPGFWKNHREVWPAEWMRIGEILYDAADLMTFLEVGGPDASLRLARHLVATRLNLAMGSDPSIVPTVEAADTFLSTNPPGSDPGGVLRDQADAIKNVLDAYNNTPCDEDGGGNGGGGYGNGGGNGNGNGNGKP